MVAQLLSALRHAPDRLVHPLRRRTARRQVRQRPSPGSMLVVCHGNICRSPFAAAVLRRQLAGTGVRVDSAGFMGPGRGTPEPGLAAAARRGEDLSAHRSRLVTPELVREAGLIVVMEPVQRWMICALFGRYPEDVVVLGDFDPDPIDVRAIPDPVEQPLEAFARSYARIERCARVLAGSIARHAA